MRFPAPTFAFVEDDGTIHLEWIKGPTGPGEVRLNLYVDAESYAHLLGPGTREDIQLETPSDVIRALTAYCAAEPSHALEGE